MLILYSLNVDGPGQDTEPMQRAESVSSVSSMSAASVSLTPVQNGSSQPIANHCTIHDESGLVQDFDVASVGSAASGLSTGTLQVNSEIVTSTAYLCPNLC
jgi:hypothetical protein